MDELQFYIDAGGFVFWPLALGTMVLWYAIGYRIAAVRRAKSRRNARTLIEDYLAGKWQRSKGVLDDAIIKAFALKQTGVGHLRRHLDEAFYPYQKELNRHAVLIKTIVYSAPLLGLLGTVSGMIETFDSLQSMTLFSQSGGIAGGISQALITTQLGLAVAIPGMIVNGMLDKRQHTIEMELAQIKDIVCNLQVEKS